MKTRLTEENSAAEKLLPPKAPDGSGIGANYIEAYIKPLNTELEDGTKVTCKRKGLKITLTIGERTGTAILRRIEHGPDAQNILRQALTAAAREAQSEFAVEEDGLYLDV